MKNILIFLIYPNRFYKKIMEGELKLFILILFVVNVFLSILWDIKIGIPFGGYEIYYFDNKLLDSSVSVALNTLALMIISGSLYVFTKKCKLENRFEKSYLIAFSLVIIDALVVITSLISFYTFDWIIKVRALFAIIFLIQSVYFFIGIRKVFSFTKLKALFVQVACYLLVGMVFSVISYLGGGIKDSGSNIENQSLAGEDENKRQFIKQEKRLLRTVDNLKLRDKSYVDIESNIIWGIGDQVLFEKTMRSYEHAEIRIRDIYKAIMTKNLLMYIYTGNGSLELIDEKNKNEIINECNQSRLKKDYGIEIISVDIKKSKT